MEYRDRIALKVRCYLDEEHITSKKGDSINNLSTVRKIAFNLTKLDTSLKDGLTLKKKMTRYMLDFTNIKNLIFKVIPSL